MTEQMAKKGQSRKQKPGPEEERLVITDDPKKALARLFRKKQPLPPKKKRGK